MKRIYLLIATMFLGFSSSLQAQIVDDEDEIIVTNEKGEKESIDIPEAMTAEVDSMLHLYNTKTYLRKDADCNLPNFNPVFKPEEF